MRLVAANIRRSLIFFTEHWRSHRILGYHWRNPVVPQNPVEKRCIKVINTTCIIWNFQKPACNIREFYFVGLVGTLTLETLTFDTPM